MDDESHKDIRIEMYSQGAEFLIECDAWIPLQFSHVFDQLVNMVKMPNYWADLPINFYLRIVATKINSLTEIIHLPGGLMIYQVQLRGCS